MLPSCARTVLGSARGIPDAVPYYPARAMASKSSDVPLVMQLLVDPRLIKGWTTGPMMAQAAHATSAVLTRSAQEPTTVEYLSEANLPQMRKVVLQIPSNTTLEQIAEELRAAGEAANAETVPEGFPKYHLWTEQPENIATCLAVAPNRKPKVSDEY